MRGTCPRADAVEYNSPEACDDHGVKLSDAAPTTRVLVVATLVSMIAFLDSSVVNLALPAIKRNLSGGFDPAMEVAAMCRDRHDAHPHLVSHFSRHGGLSGAADPAA